LTKAKNLMPNNQKLKRRLLTLKMPFLKIILGENRFDVSSSN